MQIQKNEALGATGIMKENFLGVRFHQMHDGSPKDLVSQFFDFGINPIPDSCS
jgi:hypothetical protein